MRFILLLLVASTFGNQTATPDETTTAESITISEASTSGNQTATPDETTTAESITTSEENTTEISTPPTNATTEEPEPDESAPQCHDYDGTAYCSNTDFDFLKAYLTNKTRQIKEISLQDDPLTKNLTNQLLPYPNLKKLVLKNSSVEFIHPDALTYTPKLYNLYLNGNISKIPLGLLMAVNLKTLKLVNNSLTTPEYLPFLVSGTLNNLALINNGIKNLGAESLQLPKLSELNFQENTTVAIDPRIFHNTNISKLELKGFTLNLTEQRSSLFFSDTLTEMKIHNVAANLEGITLDSLPKLKMLEMITETPGKIVLSPDIVKNTNVTKLRLGNVHLKSAENGPLLVSDTLQELLVYNSSTEKLYKESFQKLPALKSVVITVSEVREADIPTDVFQNTNVSKVQIKNLRFIKEKWLEGENIKEMALLNTGADSLTKKFLDGLPNLERLALGGNGSSLTIPQDVVTDKLFSLTLTNFKIEVPKNQPIITSDTLKELGLIEANLTKIYPETFASLKNLETINLSGNNLTVLDAGIFTNNLRLHTVDLRSNQLKTLSLNIFGDLEFRNIYLKTLGNPWTCDCELYPTLQYVMKTSGFSRLEGRCEEPKSEFYDWGHALAMLRENCSINTLQ